MGIGSKSNGKRRERGEDDDSANGADTPSHQQPPQPVDASKFYNRNHEAEEEDQRSTHQRDQDRPRRRRNPFLDPHARESERNDGALGGNLHRPAGVMRIPGHASLNPGCIHPENEQAMAAMQGDHHDQMARDQQWREYMAGMDTSERYEQRDMQANGNLSETGPAGADFPVFRNEASAFMAAAIAAGGGPPGAASTAIPPCTPRPTARGDQQLPRSSMKKRRGGEEDRTASQKKKVAIGRAYSRRLHGERPPRELSSEEEEEEIEEEEDDERGVFDQGDEDEVDEDEVDEDEVVDVEENRDQYSALSGLIAEILGDIHKLQARLSDLESRYAGQPNSRPAVNSLRPPPKSAPTRFSSSDRHLVDSTRRSIASLERQVAHVKRKAEEAELQSPHSYDDDSDGQDPDAED